MALSSGAGWDRHKRARAHPLKSALALPIKATGRVDAHLPERLLAPVATAALLAGKAGQVEPVGTVVRADLVGKFGPTDTAGTVADIADSLAEKLSCACHS